MAKGKKARTQGFGRYRKLYQDIVNGDLDDEALQNIEDPLAFEVGVNVSDDTLLHVAISKEKWEIAEKILGLMVADQLEKQNLKGDTPLHEVASKGNLKVATDIVSSNNGLLHMRNIQQEIPLHKAALSGHTEMFDYLCKEGSDIRARREGGANVLHCAVMGMHLELAEKIVRMCPDLRLFRDHLGMTPLHFLVTNPKTFKSGSKLGIIDSFIYKRILPKEDIPFYIGDAGGIQPDHTGGDADGKQPMEEDVTLIVADEDDLLTPTRSDIPYPTKGTLQVKFLYVLLARACYIAYPGFNKIKEQKRMHGQALRLVGSLCGTGGKYWTQLSMGRYPGESTSDTIEIVNLDIKHDGKNGGGLNLNGADRGKELPHILAAKMGATSFLDRILTVCPKSAKLTGDDGKNMLQVAVEHRQSKIVRLIESTEDWRRDTVSGKDKKFDTILHSVARIGDTFENLVPGSALQMQRELQWFDKVESLIPRELVYHRNLKGETAQELFTSCHADMVKSSKERLITTAQACSTLVAAVVFATSFSIPGGTGPSGQALFLNKPAFKVFTNAYVVGLSSAATALLLFVSLIIAPYDEREFRRSLPTKFTMAFFSLFVALACMVVAFSSNIYLTINGKRNAGDIVPLVCELTIFPAFAFAVLLYRRASFGFLSTVKDVFG